MKACKHTQIGVILCLFSSFLIAQTAYANELNIGAWGGSYEAAQKRVLFTPFEQQHAVSIQTIPYTGGIEILRSPHAIDVLEMEEEDAQLACEAGLLHRLDAKKILGETIAADLIEDSLLECSIAFVTFATVVAYDNRAFTDEKPQFIADFFNVDKFPGKRAAPQSPSALLEWALIAEGVPISQVYDLLSTERGLRLAFRRLDTIKEYMIWYNDPDEAAQLLRDEKATMSMGYNGRFFNEQVNGNPHITVIWHAQILDRSTWTVPLTNNHPELAYAFIAFSLETLNQARLAELIPYGPTRQSAHNRVGLHPDFSTPMQPHLPTAEHHMKDALIRDTRWYVNTHALRAARFQTWLQKN